MAENTWPDVSDGVVRHDDPVAIVRGFIVAVAAWERAAKTHLDAVQKAGGEWSGLMAGYAREYDDLVAPFLTPRERVQRPHGVGFPTMTDEGERLIEVLADSASKTTVVTHDPERPTLRYERHYVVMRRGGQWRLDNLRTRPLGSEAKWRQRLL